VEFCNKPSPTEEEIIASAQDADAVIVVVEPYTRRVIESLNSCRLICTPKMGYDNIDISAATKAGICVSCAPSASIEEVSDHTVALIMTCARKVSRLNDVVRSGIWKSLHGSEMEEIWQGIAPIRGQILGLIGFGRVSRAIVPKTLGLGFNILVYDPYVDSVAIKNAGVKSVEFTQLLKESDFIAIQCSLTDENRHMLGEEQFKQMKPTAYLINTSRGALVDEAALYKALSQGIIAGAGLDVTETEPINKHNPLLELDNVIFTGHSAHYSDDVALYVRQKPVDDVSRIISGKWPEGWINPEVEAKYISRWRNNL
jgi:D-3-phosphoglycerate dehydrogenase